MNATATRAHAEAHHKPNYWAVFIALAIFTAIMTLTELFRVPVDSALSSVLGLANPDFFIHTSFIIISLIKATLVAMYYMHLKFDSFVYTFIFLLPVLFAVFLLGVLAVGYIFV